MADKKIFEILNLLKEFANGREVVLKSYALNSGLSERTLRRYIKDLQEFFGDEYIANLGRGSYICKNLELFKPFILPNNVWNESEKLIDMLHIINPGFAKFLPTTHKKIDAKLTKDLAEIFLIKGSPHENTPDLKIFAQLKKAIKLKRYCNIIYNSQKFIDVKILKLIYCKGNWQVPTICESFDNNGYKVLRASFIDKIELKTKSFYVDDYTQNFIRQSETFWDGYKVPRIRAVVGVSPKIIKYFKTKKFFKSQLITGKVFENGWNEIEFKITSDDMILMLVRRWFPDMVVISPKSVKDKFDEFIKEYNINSDNFAKL